MEVELIILGQLTVDRIHRVGVAKMFFKEVFRMVVRGVINLFIGDWGFDQLLVVRGSVLLVFWFFEVDIVIALLFLFFGRFFGFLWDHLFLGLFFLYWLRFLGFWWRALREWLVLKFFLILIYLFVVIQVFLNVLFQVILWIF